MDSKRSGALAKLVGSLSLGALVATGCTSPQESSDGGDEPTSQPAAEHACGSACGASGCGGGSKDDKDEE